MIVVAGEPRSGTSMTMLIMRALGFTIAGLKHPSGRKDLNPDGTWEIPKIVKNGITKNIVEGRLPTICPKIEADVIKLTTVGLMSSERALIDKVVFCVRDAEEVIKSQGKIENPDPKEQRWKDYAYHMYEFIKRPYYHLHVMDYNMTIFNPRHEIAKLARWLEVQITDEAVEVVKEKYYTVRR